MSKIVSLIFAAWFGLILLVAETSPSISNNSFDKNQKTHFDGEKFVNPEMNERHGFSDMFAWKWGLKKDTVRYQYPVPENPQLPTLKEVNLQKIAQPPADSIYITWIGHATFLIQWDGINILTDPMFSKRASPVSFAGPKRLIPPALSLEELPEINMIAVSHSHYDHLDAASINFLGNQPHYLLPLGLDNWFEKKGITNYSVYDWHESQAVGDFQIYCMPAQHFSARTLWDRNQSLWCGCRVVR